MRGTVQFRLLVTMSGVAWLSVAAAPVRADINLELQSVSEPCATRFLEFALLAVSDNELDQSIAAMDVILSWDPAALQLLGLAAGPYPYSWLYSGFPNDHTLDGLNDTWSDGDALYQAYAQLGVPAYATPAGLLVTKFRFRKLLVGLPTTVEILAGGPNDGYTYTYSVVYGGPGMDVTGLLVPVTHTPGAAGDINCDGAVDFRDINPFVLALSNWEQYKEAYPDCPDENPDINCDGVVDFRDINPFVVLLAS